MEALAVQVVNLCAAALSVCGLMVLWFNTSFFVDYIKLFRLTRFTYIKEYEKELFDNPDLSFLEFSLIKEPTFLNKLLACPYCLAFWLSAFCCWAMSSILLTLTCYPLSLFFYFIFKKCQRNI